MDPPTAPIWVVDSIVDSQLTRCGRRRYWFGEFMTFLNFIASFAAYEDEDRHLLDPIQYQHRCECPKRQPASDRLR